MTYPLILDATDTRTGNLVLDVILREARIRDDMSNEAAGEADKHDDLATAARSSSTQLDLDAEALREAARKLGWDGRL